MRMFATEGSLLAVLGGCFVCSAVYLSSSARSEANFEKRLIEEGAVTGSLRGSDWLLTGPQWTKPLLLDGGGRDTLIMSLKSKSSSSAVYW